MERFPVVQTIQSASSTCFTWACVAHIGEILNGVLREILSHMFLVDSRWSSNIILFSHYVGYFVMLLFTEQYALVIGYKIMTFGSNE